MRARRPLLFAAALLLAASAARRGAAGEAVDLDADATAGQSTGGWACGPTSHARYAGGAGRIRYVSRDRDDDDRIGGSAELGVSLERESQHAVISGADCARAPTACGPLPPDATMVGADARVGVQTRWFGAEAGALAASQWTSNHDTTPSGLLWPDVRVRLGRAEHGLRFVAGTGAATPAQIRRVSVLYGGVGWTSDGGVAMDAYPSLSRSGPGGDLAWRLDGGLAVPVAEHVVVRAGASLGVFTQTIDAPLVGSSAQPDARYRRDLVAIDPAASLGVGARF